MIVTDRSDQIVQWVHDHIPGSPGFTTPSVGVGVVVGHRLLAGVVWHNYRDFDIEGALYAVSPRWLSAPRSTLAQIFGYPFKQLGVERITGTAAKDNHRLRRLLRGVGFKEEGTLRRGYDGRRDAIVYGMLRSDCRWLSADENSRSVLDDAA